MKYNNFRCRDISSISEANNIIKTALSCGAKLIYVDLNHSVDEAKSKISDFNYTKYIIVKEHDSHLHIETKWWEPKNKATRYIVDLNGESKVTVQGRQCFAQLQKNCYKAPSCETYNLKTLVKDPETGSYIYSAGPIIGYNPKYELQELHDVYEYDLNSAYSSIMLNAIPDVNNIYKNCKVKKGQVGFWLREGMPMTETIGIECDVVFDLITLSPYQKKYIEKLYDMKRCAITPEEKTKAKLWLNAGIGYYQRYNPFIRAYIVHKCNRVISGLLDDETVLWNTDAIFSLKRRPELALGASIGEWKEEVIKRFVYKGNNYQIDNEIPVYRGIPKSWFKGQKFDLLNQAIPKRCNKYVYDISQNKIVKNKEY